MPGSPGPVGRAAPAAAADLSGRNSLMLAIAGFGLTLMAFLLASLGGALAGLVLCSSAVVIGLRARRRARNERMISSGADVGIAVGAVGLVFALIIAGTSALLYQEMSTYGKCLNVSNTHSDREACREQLMRGVEKKFGKPRGWIENGSLFD